MSKVAILEDVKGTARNVFIEAGYPVETFPKSVTEEGLRGYAENAVVLGVRSGPDVTPSVLSDSLLAVDVFGVGTNHIVRKGKEGSGEMGTDERGIAIFNDRHENTRSVAELVIGSTFSLFR